MFVDIYLSCDLSAGSCENLLEVTALKYADFLFQTVGRITWMSVYACHGTGQDRSAWRQSTAAAPH